MYTGDSGRKARQPRREPEGARSEWSEATSYTLAAAEGRWAPASSAPYLPALPLPLATADLTARLLFSSRLLLEVRAQVCSVRLPFRWAPGGGDGGPQDLLLSSSNKNLFASFRHLFLRGFGVLFGN